jgi:hypothetical protein
LTELTAATSSAPSVSESKPLETTAQKEPVGASSIPLWLLALVAGVAVVGIAAASVMLYLLRKSNRT